MTPDGPSTADPGYHSGTDVGSGENLHEPPEPTNHYWFCSSLNPVSPVGEIRS